MDNNTGWISVKDKLPNHDNKVLVATESFIDIAVLVSYNGRFEYTDGIDSLFLSDTGLIKEVTHWMELPNLPLDNLLSKKLKNQ